MLIRQLVLLVLGAVLCQAAKLDLKQSDHVCIIGNTLADRLQHSGYFEAAVYARYPRHDLVFRNLGFAGDELTVRLRSESFGSPDEWLTHEKADVILAFFGFNESFSGVAGLPRFRKDLNEFIEHTRAQNYSGKGAPRLILFSPIAQEKHQDPNFPDPREANKRMEPYVQAMAEVAREAGVPFIDLFNPSIDIFGKSRQSLTVNGIHLNDAGYRALAPVMFEQLFGEPLPTIAIGGPALLQAVQEKNREFFQRYRTVDGYNVYGGRSQLVFDGVKNRDTMQREMAMRDVLTRNGDRRIWSVVQASEKAPEVEPLPPPIEVKSNKPGPNPDGSHVFLTGQQGISKMSLPRGLKVNLFASEEQFPELVKPVQMAFDTKGRLWVAAWANYPERTPQSKKGDSLLVFEDTDGDGKADKCTTFLDDLNCPTGFQFYKDGVIVVQAPDVWFVRDTDGDGKADWKERILDGMDSADSHHTANSLVLDPGGAIYLSDGVFHRTQVETARGPVRNRDAAIYRFEPRSGRFETYISYGFANPHGRVFDGWGNDLVTDATGNNTYFGAAFSGHIDYPEKHPALRQFWERPSRPCAGTGLISSRHFPEEFQGNFLNCNVIGFQGIYRVRVKEEGSGLWGETLEGGLIQSSDPNFRPTAVDVGPDGALYFLDWQNPIIGHMQHHLRDPNRDHAHGRIYRVTYEGRPLLKPAQIAGAPIEKLLELLKEPENNVRTRAKIELGARDTSQVIPAVQKWIAQFDSGRPENQHHLMEALWVHQWHNVINESLLRLMLRSSDPHARAAAVRVLCQWRDRVRDTLPLVRQAANDPSPRVRLEAVRTLSFLSGEEAMEAAYDILKYPTDYYLDYAMGETKRQLQKTLKGLFLPKDSTSLTKALEKSTDKELLAAAETEPVLQARVQRRTLDLNAHTAAIDALGKLHKKTRSAEALAFLARLDSTGTPNSVLSHLGMILTADAQKNVADLRHELTRLSREARNPLVRQAAFAGLVTADGTAVKLWRATETDANGRVALIDATAMMLEPSLRATYQPDLVSVVNAPSAPAAVRDSAFRALPLMGADNLATNFGLLAKEIRAERNMTIASLALLQLPREAWQKSELPPLIGAILHWAKAIPVAERSKEEFVATLQAGTEMAQLLPAAQGRVAQKELLALGVRVFVIKTVREQMRYDTGRLIVEKGKPFEIIFENTDMMPHNLVVIQPGSREEVGTAAERMQPVLDKQGKMFVPSSRQILGSTRLLENGQKERLKLTAPSRVGNYEYVCTYPEHWKVMFGTLSVVDKLEEAGLQSPPARAGEGGTAHQH